MKIADDRARVGPFELDRALKRRNRLIAFPALLMDNAEQVMRHVTRGVGSGALLRKRERFAAAAGMEGQFGERFVGCRRVARRGERRVLARAVGTLLQRVNPRQRQVRLGLEWIELEYFPESHNRIGRATSPLEALRKRFPGVQHFRLLARELLKLGGGFGVAARRRKRQRVFQSFVRLNLIFGIGQLGVCGWDRRRADVAKRLETLADICRYSIRRGRCDSGGCARDPVVQRRGRRRLVRSEVPAFG